VPTVNRTAFKALVEAYAELCEQLIEYLAEEPELVLAAKADIETQTGFVDAHNHLLLDDIITCLSGGQ
jgi:hypothetical protein